MTASEYYRTIAHRKRLFPDEVRELAQLYMQKFGLEGWSVEVEDSDSHRKREGCELPVSNFNVCGFDASAQTYHDLKLIWINSWACYGPLKRYRMDAVEMRQIILHEIAHALVDRKEKGHGPL